MAYEANGCLGSGRVQTEIEISPGPSLRRTLLEHIKNSSDHFRFWHKCEVPAELSKVRFLGQSGRHLLALSSFQFAPNRTLNTIRAAQT